MAVTGTDIAAIITAAGGATAAVLGAYALVRRKVGELSEAELQRCEDCYAWRRAALRVLNLLRDLLSEQGIPEPEGIDDELGLRRRRSAVAAGDDQPAA